MCSSDLVEKFVQGDAASWDEVEGLLEAIAASPVTPVVFDLVSPARIILGFAGTAAEVEWQLAEVAKLNIKEPSCLYYLHPLPGRVSVLPSRLIDTLREIRPDSFIARAGNGVIEYRGGAERNASQTSSSLAARLEAAFR